VDPSSYLDLSRPGEPRERTAYFVLDALLRSRIECGFESNSTRDDEEVNVYLVGLLSHLVSSPVVGALTRDRDVDVFEQVRGSTDVRFKAQVYRTNADHLLVSSSLFAASPYVDRGGRRDFGDETLDRISRGKTYYRFAAEFQTRAPAHSAAFAHVLGTLSEDFERYVNVLFHMRGEYFNLYERLRDSHLAALRPSGESEEALGSLAILRNEFLDAYWTWHQRPDAGNRARLETATHRLRAVDPTFRFDFPN
jgi:hypothetical protein